MSVHPVPPSTPPGGRGRGEQRRADAVDRLLTSLEHLVRRHRALAADGGHIALHAELEVDHFLDVVRPLLAEQGAAPRHSMRGAVDGAIGRHVEYLDALLREHEEDTARGAAL